MKDNARRYGKFILLVFSIVLCMCLSYVFYTAYVKDTPQKKLENLYELLKSEEPFYASVAVDKFFLELQIFADDEYIIISNFEDQTSVEICLEDQEEFFYNDELIEDYFCEAVAYRELFYEQVYTEDSLEYSFDDERVIVHISDTLMIEITDEYYYFETIVNNEVFQYEIREGIIIEKEMYEQSVEKF